MIKFFVTAAAPVPWWPQCLQSLQHLYSSLFAPLSVTPKQRSSVSNFSPFRSVYQQNDESFRLSIYQVERLLKEQCLLERVGSNWSLSKCVKSAGFITGQSTTPLSLSCSRVHYQHCSGVWIWLCFQVCYTASREIFQNRNHYYVLLCELI